MKNIIIIILLIGLILVLLQEGCLHDKIKEIEYNNKVLNDTLISIRNENGELVSKIGVFESDKITDLLNLKSKDSTILQLQSDLARNKKKLAHGGSAAVIGTVTDAHLLDTITSRGRDTIRIGNTIEIFPEYSSSITQFGEWITGNVKMNKDSIDMKIHIKHDYSLVIGTESQGLFKPRVPFAELTNRNPYDSTTSLRVANIKLPKTHTGTKIGIGILLGIIGGYLLWH